MNSCHHAWWLLTLPPPTPEWIYNVMDNAEKWAPCWMNTLVKLCEITAVRTLEWVELVRFIFSLLLLFFHSWSILQQSCSEHPSHWCAWRLKGAQWGNLLPCRRTCPGELGLKTGSSVLTEGTGSNPKDPVTQEERHREAYWRLSVKRNQLVCLKCPISGVTMARGVQDGVLRICLGMCRKP